jgi:hypothetical protein
VAIGVEIRCGPLAGHPAPGEEVGFAADSPVEGAGFEPSVPRQKDNAFRDSPQFGNSPSARKTGSFATSTTGSNPSPPCRLRTCNGPGIDSVRRPGA